MNNKQNFENATLNTIFHRRSLRKYADRPISPEIIDLILHGAMRAPTAGNMMLYSIIHVSDQKIKDTLAKTCDNQPFIAKAPLVLVFLADMQRWYDFYIQSEVQQECKIKGVEFRTPKESDLLLASNDALIAAQNTVITAESLGLGSCFIGDIMENYETHKKLFNLPRWTFPIAMLCLGYPKNPDKTLNLTPRFPKEYICFENTYSEVDFEGFQKMFITQHPSKFSIQELNSKEQIKKLKKMAQEHYFRKTGAEFSHEMQRSVKYMLKNWCSK
ncbi:MAG: nitroreductase family protein [Promethearchaeota archaeon]